MKPVIPLDQMTTKEKLLAMEEIWESLSQTPESIPSPAWHADVLVERDAKVQSGQTKPVDWDEAKRDIRRRAKEIKRKIRGQASETTRPA